MIAWLAGLGRRRVALLAVAAVAVIASSITLVPALVSLGGTGSDDLFAAALGAYGATVYVLVGVVVLWKRPGHGIGRLSLAIGLAFTTSIVLTILPLPDQLTEVGNGLAMGLSMIGWLAGGSLLVLWFPDGRRTSQLGALLELILIVAIIGLVLASSGLDLGLESDIAFIVGLSGFVLFGLGAVADLFLRYRRADVVGRTQMRWVIAAEALIPSAIIAFLAMGEVLEWLFAVMFFSFGLPVLAVAIAITRYHLYDIDRIISRSISYVVVSAVLIGVFIGLVLIMQGIVSGVVATPGSELDPRVVAISTLAVAALFNPVRRRVQTAVDRRFHRASYDAARIVAGFSGRLRDQLDLPTVSGELRATTVQALEPTATAVWLRPRSAHR